MNPLRLGLGDYNNPLLAILSLVSKSFKNPLHSHKTDLFGVLDIYIIPLINTPNLTEKKCHKATFHQHKGPLEVCL